VKQAGTGDLNLVVFATTARLFGMCGTAREASERPDFLGDEIARSPAATWYTAGDAIAGGASRAMESTGHGCSG
jgi:hypothetical protein